MSAIISPCGTYRYTLERSIPQAVRWVRPCLFIMLNPSIADATKNDPTIKKCMKFAWRWKCTHLTVVNLFAYRATKPHDMLNTAIDRVGPDNDRHIVEQIRRASLNGIIVAAWGANQHFAVQDRIDKVEKLLPPETICLRKTAKTGRPEHPLFVPYEVEPVLLNDSHQHSQRPK